jgi:hypothetical protein
MEVKVTKVTLSLSYSVHQIYDGPARIVSVPAASSSVTYTLYTVCLKGKCTDFPMDELEM